MAWMWAVQGPSVSTFPNMGRTITAPPSSKRLPCDMGTVLAAQAPALVFLGPRRPPSREGPKMLPGVRIARLGRDLSRHADAPLHDLAVAELGEALGRDQHARERAFAARPEQGGEVGLPGLGHRGGPEARPRPQGSIGVPGRDHAFPMAALQGGRVRLAPYGLGLGEISPRHSL